MSGARLLVVEDEPLSRDVLVRMLASRGHSVESVASGPACLDWLEHETPDVVLLDVSMPGMSGLDVLRCIRQRFTHDQLPVILVTALVDSDDVVIGLEAGANDYVVKPVNLPVLLARISVALKIKRGVQRLIQAERHRVMLEALDDACDRLDAPLDSVIRNLEELIADHGDADGGVRPRLEDTLDWARRAGELIRKYRKIAGYQKVPYTDGLEGFVSASLASADRRANDL